MAVTSPRAPFAVSNLFFVLGIFAKAVVFVLPLGLDVLTVSTALGTLGLTGWARWRVSLVLASCQVAAMLIGLALGAGLAQAIGEPAGYVGARSLYRAGRSPAAGPGHQRDRTCPQAD